MEDTSTVWCMDCQFDIPAVLAEDHAQRHEVAEQRPDPGAVIASIGIIALGIIAGLLVAQL